MATWNKMTPRERDAWVAEHIMGWRPPNTPSAIRSVFPIPWDVKWDYFNPPPEVEEWRNNYFWREPCGACSHGPPFHTTNASDDYLVLQKVRETWNIIRINEFTDGLFQIQRHRSLPSISYKPGDYSYAAYLALKETP